MYKAIVNKVIPFSSVDGPGNRLAIFFQGCNFNCLYCHNPETINICSSCGNCLSSCSEKALSFIDNKINWDATKCIDCDECIKSCKNYSSPKVTNMSVEGVMKSILKVRNFIQGITTSGGECTLNEEFLVELFKEAKRLGLTCYLDSNGSKDFKLMEELIEITDKVMLDIKAWDNIEHLKLTGCTNETVLKNLHYLNKRNKLYEVRTVIVPDLLDNKFTVSKVSEYLGKYSNNVRYKLIKYRPLGVRKNLINNKVPSTEYMKELKSIAETNGIKNVIIV